jgi:hypothetical protein
MTAKEKAKELYLKMLNWQTDSNKFLETNIISTSAKQCALIEIDGRIEEVEHWLPRVIFLNEVKQEIQNL